MSSMKRILASAGFSAALALSLLACNNESVDLLAQDAPRIAFADSVVTWRVGVADTLVAASTGGRVFKWSIAPALPSGLRLDSLGGALTGTPLDTLSSKAYVLTARGPGGNGTARFALRIVADSAAP